MMGDGHDTGLRFIKQRLRRASFGEYEVARHCAARRASALTPVNRALGRQPTLRGTLSAE
jgi:hypothetical protein